MQLIRWEHYPRVAAELHARQWLQTQAMLGLAPATIHAYGRGANDYLAFCQRTARPFVEATREDVVAYIAEMTRAPILAVMPSATCIRASGWPTRRCSSG